jgi:hypothetical protein
LVFNGNKKHCALSKDAEVYGWFFNFDCMKMIYTSNSSLVGLKVFTTEESESNLSSNSLVFTDNNRPQGNIQED